MDTAAFSVCLSGNLYFLNSLYDAQPDFHGERFQTLCAVVHCYLGCIVGACGLMSYSFIACFLGYMKTKAISSEVPSCQVLCHSDFGDRVPWPSLLRVYRYTVLVC